MPTQKLLERKALIVGIVINVLQVLAGMAVFFMTGLKAMFLDFSFTAISVLSGMVAVYLSSRTVRTTERFPNGMFALEPIYAICKAIFTMSLLVYSLIDVCRVAYDYFVFGSGERIETGPVVIYEILTVIVCFSLYTYYRRSNRSIGDSLDFLHYTGDFFITVALVALTIKEPFSVLKEAFVELVGGVHDDDETNAYVEAEAQRHLPANTDYEQTLIFKTGMNYTVDVYLSGIGETIDVADLIECKRSLEKELSKRLHIVDVDFVFD